MQTNRNIAKRGCSKCKRKWPIITVNRRWGFMPFWFFPVEYQNNTHKVKDFILCDDCLKYCEIK